MSAESTKPEARKIEARILDRPDLMETFADAVGPLSFDGNTLRIEFLVARMGAVASGQAPAIHAVPACRLVLTAKAATDLVNRLRSLSEQIQKQAAQSPQGRETK
jgi:hypothetical protein